MWSPCIVEHNTKLNSLVLTLMRSDQCDCVAHQIETAHWSRATQEKCWLLKVVGSIWCNQLGCISRRDILCKQPVTQSAPHPAALHCIVLLCSWVEFILSHCCALSCPACTSLQLQLLHQTTIQGTCPQSFSREGGLYFNYWVTLVQCVKLFKGSLFNLCEGLIES